MKVLFVRSGNRGTDPITTRQANSLSKNGAHVEFYEVNGKGLLGYIKNVTRLRDKIKQTKPNVIHAHYSLCGFLTSLTLTKIPTVVSLMGTDVIEAKGIELLLLKFCSKYLWRKTIFKSLEMSNKVKTNRSTIVPNGVDLDVFREIDMAQALQITKWDPLKLNILFSSSPERPEKNYELAQDAIDAIKSQFNNIEVHFLMNVDLETIPYYYNSANLLLLTSSHEGSPNVIKEALACNCPIVSTDVGDVRSLLEGVEGCYITGFKKEDVSSALIKAINFKGRVKGREIIIRKSIDAESVAKKIIGIYNEIVK